MNRYRGLLELQEEISKMHGRYPFSVYANIKGRLSEKLRVFEDPDCAEVGLKILFMNGSRINVEEADCLNARDRGMKLPNYLFIKYPNAVDFEIPSIAKGPMRHVEVSHDEGETKKTKGYHRRRVSCYRAANPEAGLALEIPVDITAMTRFRRELDEACQLVSEGKLKKLVLALAAPVRSSSGAPLTREELLAALWSSQVSPMSSRFAVGPLVGSSPELLISRRGPLVKSRPLAGTRPRGRGGELLSSTKDLLEHSLVVDDITARLRPFCTVEPRAVGPVAVEVPGLSHLATDISGELSPSPGIPSSGHGTSYPSALDLVLAIHPTPAISGIPRAEALRSIASIEARPRGFYGGVVGWVDSRGDGDWMLAIRSLQLGDEPDAVLAFAGAGIVPGSDADTELAEVYSKLTAILSLFE